MWLFQWTEIIFCKLAKTNMKAECKIKTRDGPCWPPKLIHKFCAAGKRPEFERSDLGPAVKDKIKKLIKKCWHEKPEVRPTFDSIFERLQAIRFKLFCDVNVNAIGAYVKSVLACESGND
jgi:hypothetical protein